VNADGHPIVGADARAPGVYLAVMHSGMTLAPLVGQLAAIEILDEVRVEILEPYRISRFDA
jgi:glycine/D-amino acid oxidase-like deaminating enzyme